MKIRISTTVVLLLALACPVLSWAQSPASAGSPGKIGLLNIQEAIASTAEGKQALGELEKKYQPKRAELQQLQQEIASLEEQLQRGSTALSDDERARLTREHDTRATILKRTQEDAQANFQADNQDIGRRVGQKMVRIINDYAQENGFAVILDPAAAQVPVYYAVKDADILNDIVKRYDAANPVSAAATPSTTRPPTHTPVTSKPGAKPADKPK
jgi:outer membrane protein